MLAADAIGDPLLVSELFSGTQRNDVTSIEALVSGEQGSTIVFHGQGVAQARMPGNDTEIFFQQFENNVASGLLANVNQITRGEQFHPKADMAADGTFWVVWSGRGEGDRQGVFARRFAADGSALTDQVRVNTTRGGDQSRADIGVASDGSAVVVWHGVGDGDHDGVFAQRLSATGELVGSETLVNETTSNVQAYPVIAVDTDGSFVVAWSSRNQDQMDGTAGDWGVFARRFNADGTAIDGEFQVAVQTPGSQHLPAIDMADTGDFVITWSSLGQDSDGWGVYARQFTADGTPGGETQVSSEEIASQRNSNVAVSSAGEFVITWMETRESRGWEVVARAFNTDGDADGDQFTVSENANRLDLDVLATPSVALNGFGNSVIAFQGDGTGDHRGVFAQPYDVDVEPPVDVDPTITPISETTARVGEAVEIVAMATDPNREDTLTFRLEVDGDANELKGATLTDNGDRTATLRWTPRSEDRAAPVTFRIVVEDNNGGEGDATQFAITVANGLPVVTRSDSGTINLDRGETMVAVTSDTLSISDPDGDDLTSATARIRGTLDPSEELTVDTTDTQITSLFDTATGTLTLTGADTIANYERVLRSLAYSNKSDTPTAGERSIDISVNDGFESSAQLSIVVRVQGPNQAPSLSVNDQTLLAGSPLNIGLNGVDVDGDDLTYTVTTSSAAVEAEIRSGNRSWRLDVDSPGNNINGTMIFEFFEDMAPRATDRFITLTQDGFYDGIIFHRVINDFVIQGGDPLGNGTGGSDLGDFDDQLHVDLQHNTTGLLSMAKTVDDTNNSQFFVTEGPSRNLDGNHTIFGILTEGEAIRDAISEIAVGTGDRPVNAVTITEASVFTDTENATLSLKAADGFTGTVDVTVMVSDGSTTTSETFTVTVEPDSLNTRPWLGDIGVIETAVDTPTTFQLQGFDVEGDDVSFYGPTEAATANMEDRLDGIPGNQFPVLQPPAGLDVSVDAESGLMTVTPSGGITGTFQVTVGASNVPPGTSAGFNQQRVNDFQTIEIRIT